MLNLMNFVCPATYLTFVSMYTSSVLDIAAIENIDKAALLGCQQSDKGLRAKADISGTCICCTIR